MNNLPRQMLVRIIAKHGKDIGGDARRCEGLLNDLCGAYRREINVLVNAVEERIPLDLLAGAGSMPHELLLTRLEKRLEDQTAMNADAARWAVESWALALGAVTDSEIEQRARKQSAHPSVKPAPIQPTESKKESVNPNVSNTNRQNHLPQSPKKHSPVPPLKPMPQNRPPVVIPPASPPVYVPANHPPPFPAQTANPPPQPSNPVVVKSRFGILRGCLIIVFLLAVASVVLLFGVPYAIETMRETQRERNSEPPRFPVR